MTQHEFGRRKANVSFMQPTFLQDASAAPTSYLYGVAKCGSEPAPPNFCYDKKVSWTRSRTSIRFDENLDTIATAILPPTYPRTLAGRDSNRIGNNNTHTKMSAMRNAVQRRKYRERAQPLERQKLGLLEKHKVRPDIYKPARRAATHSRSRSSPIHPAGIQLALLPLSCLSLTHR